MVVCERCGTKNPLGRVFCISCGTKLSLAGMRKDEVAEIQRESRIAAHLRGFAILALVIVLLLCAVALWPNQKRLGASGTRVGATRVETRLRLIEQLPPGTRLGPEPALSEEDINGYLQFVVAEELKGVSASVSISKSVLRVKTIFTLGDVVLGPIRVTPRYSVEGVWLGEGGRLKLRNAVIGHLPLPLFLSSSVAQGVVRVFQRLPEWNLFQHVKQVTLDDGKLGLTVER
ncbi:MAG: zinc-ribbon domain-containing protein [Kiritimatiellia bacterium]